MNAAAPPSRSLRLSSILAALVIIPHAFDFKAAEEGGTVWQYVLAGITLFAAVLFLVNVRLPRSKGRLWRFSSAGILFAVVGAFITSFINEIEVSRFIRVVFPLLYFAMGFYIAAALVHGGRLELLRKLLLTGCAISSVFSVIAGFMISGADASEIRYQILSPVLLVFEAILLHNAIIARRRVLLSTLALVACVALQVLSVTRAAVLGVLLLALVTLWINSRSVVVFGKRLSGAALVLSIVGVFAFYAAETVYPEVGERWQTRIGMATENEIDPTALSRIAEFSEQLRLWSETPLSIVIGRGYGAEYGWAEQLARQLSATGAFSRDVIEQRIFVAGHNFWINSLFAGGLMFGLVVPALLLIGVWAGSRESRRRLPSPALLRDKEAVTIGTLVLVGTLANTIGTNPMGVRYPGLIVGMGLGMLVVGCYRMREGRARSRQQMVGVPPGLMPLPRRI